MKTVKTIVSPENKGIKATLLEFPLVLIFLLSVISCFGQDVNFTKVFPSNSRTWQHVTGITQDKKGSMWFATKNGLYAYNGYDIKSFKHESLNPNSISSYALGAVSADQAGNIWIGTLGSGLDKYDAVSGVFDHYSNDPEDPSSINSDYINTLMVDRDNIVWIGTGTGLDSFDPNTSEFIHYHSIPGDSTSLSCDEIMTIYEDRDGAIWIGTGSVYGAGKDDIEFGGLNRLDKETGIFTRFKHEPDNINSLINNKVSAIFEDSQGTLWIGTAGDGLHTMDKSSGKIIRHPYDPANPEKLSRPPIATLNPEFDHITFIIQDASGLIWIGASDAGLSCYDPASKSTTYIQNETAEGLYDDNSAWAAYTSYDGVLWISSMNGNLYRHDALRSEVPFVDLPGQYPNAFYKDRSGRLWWGSDKIHVSGNPYEGLIQKINAELSRSSKVNFVRVIQEDRQGNLLIGGGGGLFLLDLGSGQYTHFVNDPGNNNSLSNNNIASVSEDRNNNLWVATLYGLNRLDPVTGEVKRFYVDIEDTALFGANFIRDVQVDNEGKVWVALTAGKGLCRLNEASGEFEQYLSAFIGNCLFKDSQGTLWAGTNDGLFYLDSVEGTFKRFRDLNSLFEITSVENIIEDNDHNLWITSQSGLIEINASREEIKSYGTNYGVHPEILSWDANYKDNEGYLYFGCNGGYYKFLPSELKTKAKPPLVEITGFNISDRSGGSFTSSTGETFSLTKDIRLAANQNTFSFDFATIDYSDPAMNQNLFMLKNYDDDWRESNADRRAYYFNIPPGRYTFRVKGANSYGVWAEKAIDVIIYPPWWKTIWAYIVYGLIFIAAVLLVHNFQRRRVIRAERARAQQKELEQAREIEKAYKELQATQKQLVHAEKMASLGELTAGIAHEIQNPLNFVNNFSEVNLELISELKEGLGKEEVDDLSDLADNILRNEERINTHGKRADSIVKGMLQHSRSSNGEKSPTDINALADEFLRLSYHGMRARDKSFNADFRLEADESLPKASVVPQDIGRVLLNLINNAFYAVNEKAKQNIPEYKPEVIISTSTIPPIRGDKSPLGDLGVHGDKGAIEIRIKDNGNGIPDDIREKIFQPFFTTKPAGQGTGLGLSMSYDIITKGHGGQLKVESKPGEETVFIILLPAEKGS